MAPAVGTDLGTTRSGAAVLAGGDPRLSASGRAADPTPGTGTRGSADHVVDAEVVEEDSRA